jgi:hypothetical protein
MMKPAPQVDRPQYLLLLRQPHGPVPTPEELGKIMARFDLWMKKLSERGMVLGTNGLGLTGTVLRGPGGRSVNDGPFVESKEIIGGYVLITAGTYEEALEAARDCPGLDYGMAVEVRPVVPRR